MGSLRREMWRVSANLLPLLLRLLIEGEVIDLIQQIVHFLGVCHLGKINADYYRRPASEEDETFAFELF